MKWNNDPKLIEVIILSMTILWIFGFNLIVCESGGRVTDQFDRFSMELSECDWNELPIEMQRLYLIFLGDTQQPKNVKSYAGIMCLRGTFKEVPEMTL